MDCKELRQRRGYQRGLASLGYDQGRYVADRAESWFSESVLHRFHRQVLEALGDMECAR